MNAKKFQNTHTNILTIYYTLIKDCLKCSFYRKSFKNFLFIDNFSNFFFNRKIFEHFLQQFETRNQKKTQIIYVI